MRGTQTTENQMLTRPLKSPGGVQIRRGASAFVDDHPEHKGDHFDQYRLYSYLSSLLPLA